jgi:hypothetical protein
MNPESATEPSREELIALVVAQRAEIAALKAQVAELERRLGLKVRTAASRRRATG